MWQNLDQLLQGYEPWQVAIEFLVIWVCVYIIFTFLQGTRGAGVIKGFAVLIVAVTLALRVLGQGSDAFARLNFIYDRFLGLLAILLIVVFQPELRQAMIRLGHGWSFRASRSALDRVVDAVSEAVGFLSKSQFGALIAIERQSKLGGLIETGTMLDAEINAALLESIFWPNSPLHDLGVVVRGDRIVAASVQFPLAEEGVLSTEYGSRHRAAVGLTLESDCIVVIVSEESGGISIAEHGELHSAIPRDEFREVLAERLATTPRDTPTPDAPTTSETAAGAADKQAA
jgi:diadenylate cyclase